MSISPTSPANIFGGTWEALDEGRVLIGANTEYPVNSTGGEKTHVLTTSEMPSHNHTESSAGSHSHGGSALLAGGHTHSRGTMNITGGNFASPNADPATGPFYKDGSMSGATGGATGSDAKVMFDASRSGAWTGATSSSGSHSHTLSVNSGGSHTHTINNAGSGGAHNNMQPYLAVYMWKRTA